jgi:uncharacterized damage-inducible protein DinB
MSKRIVLLQALASTPGDLGRILQPVSDRALHWRPANGEWPAAAVLIHLAQVEKAYRRRLQRMAGEEEPHVPAIDPQVHEVPEGVTARQLLQAFEDERSQTIVFLQELLPGGWQRAAIHETLGRVTIRSQVQNLVEHDIEHSNQLVGVLQQMRKEIERLRE